MITFRMFSAIEA